MLCIPSVQGLVATHL